MVSRSVQDYYCTLSGKRHMTDQQIYKVSPLKKNPRRLKSCLAISRHGNIFYSRWQPLNLFTSYPRNATKINLILIKSSNYTIRSLILIINIWLLNQFFVNQVFPLEHGDIDWYRVLFANLDQSPNKVIKKLKNKTCKGPTRCSCWVWRPRHSHFNPWRKSK